VRNVEEMLRNVLGGCPKRNIAAFIKLKAKPAFMVHKGIVGNTVQ
jgi:hypothetical protein